MNNFLKIDSVHPVRIDIDYKNPLLDGNVMGLDIDVLGEYKSFLGKFKTILEKSELENGLIQPGHHRAHLSPETNIIDVGGKIFFYRSLKGSGLSNPSGYKSIKDGNWTIKNHTDYNGEYVPELVLKNITKEYDWGYEIMGCFDDRVFSKLKRVTSELNNSNARVEMIATSGILKEVVFNGKKVSVDELKENGTIPNDTNLKLRQFERLTRSRIRIKDFLGVDELEKTEIFKETLALLNKEKEILGQEQRYDLNDINNSINPYLCETAENLGKNLGIFFSKGYTMGFMNSGNITLGAGEIVDLDSISELSEMYKTDNINNPRNIDYYEGTNLPKEIVKDIRDVLTALNMLIKGFEGSKVNRENITNSFLNGFNLTYKHSKRLENFYSKESLDKVLNLFTRTILLNGHGIGVIS